MKIKVETIKPTSTLNDVPNGDLFICMKSGDVYLKTSDKYRGEFIVCYSIRDGERILLNKNMKVRLVRGITLMTEDFPKRRNNDED